MTMYHHDDAIHKIVPAGVYAIHTFVGSMAANAQQDVWIVAIEFRHFWCHKVTDGIFQQQQQQQGVGVVLIDGIFQHLPDTPRSWIDRTRPVVTTPSLMTPPCRYAKQAAPDTFAAVTLLVMQLSIAQV